jgi:hypothetical protein
MTELYRGCKNTGQYGSSHHAWFSCSVKKGKKIKRKKRKICGHSDLSRLDVELRLMEKDFIIIGDFQAPLEITLSMFGSQPFCIPYKPFGPITVAAWSKA